MAFPLVAFPFATLPLDDVKAENLRIAKVFSSGGDIHYILPYFQREYTWGKEEWTTLLNDALAVYDETKSAPPNPQTEIEHFLGSIVVIPDGTRSGTMAAFKLVDGQQRLTSLTLLLQALAKNIKASHPATARRIERLLVNSEEKGDLFFKILPTTKYGDREAYSAIMRGENSGKPESKISGAFDFYFSEIEKRLAGGMDADAFFLVLTNSFQIVFIELHQNESPYKIFESLNAKGKSLSQADLVRNYIAMKLPAAKQEQVFVQSWGKIEAALQEVRTVGRLGELTAFIRHYLALRTEVLVEERHVYARFRDYMEKQFIASSDFEVELAEMTKLAIFYNQLLRPQNSPLKEVRLALERLNRLESSSCYPLLLALLSAENNAEITSVVLLKMLGTVENYMVRRYLTNESISYLNKVFPGLWKQLNHASPDESLKEILATKGYPTDEKVQRELRFRKLYDKNASVRSRTSLILESINRKLSEGTGGYTVLDGSSTIEHVMPQTLSEGWKASLGLMWETIHKDFLHTLGNLTLITGEWNSELSNAVFEVKRERLSSNALMLNSKYFTQKIPRWGRDEIVERTEVLGETILELWPSLIPYDPTAPVVGRKVEAMEFHFESIERVAVKLGVGLSALSQSRFESKDSTKRVVGLCSKKYPGSGDFDFTYWYGFKPSQRDFLSWQGESWVALECDTPSRILFFQFSEFEPLLRKMNVTAGKHWHVSVAEKKDQMLLSLAADKIWSDVTAQLLRTDD